MSIDVTCERCGVEHTQKHGHECSIEDVESHLQEKLDLAKEVLREIEWAGYLGTCPCCEQAKEHADDCKLHQVLEDES